MDFYGSRQKTLPLKKYINLLKKTWKDLLEVDVEYPKELHKNYNELRFVAEKMKIGSDEILEPHLNNNNGYVVHIKKLNQALKHGLKLKKVYRAIEFEHSNWMKPYIMLNTKLRIAAKNEFEKDFFKLLINSVFGRTMENQEPQGYEVSDKLTKISEVCHEVEL